MTDASPSYDDFAPPNAAATALSGLLEPDASGLDDEAGAPDDPASRATADGLGHARGLHGALHDDRLCDWIGRVALHDEAALSALYDATAPRVLGFVRRLVRRPALAEEVVEDTFFQVWRQAARFDASRGRAITWLLGMARSRAIDALRREARFHHDSLDADDAADTTADGAPGGDAVLDVARRHAELHRALLALQAQPRQLVALAFFKGLSHEEIAAHVELPLGTVKSQIRRALITLRQALHEAARPALASS